jgi:hypothetical protein
VKRAFVGSVLGLALLGAGVFGSAASGGQAARGGSGPYFAPYIDMAAYPPPDLAAIKSDSGRVKMISLGFVTADQGPNAHGKAKCEPTWGGYSPYKAEGKKPYRESNIDKFRNHGGQLVLSFGGAAGVELASACNSVKSLTAAYRKAIKAYHATRLDFDVEGVTIADKSANNRRAAALRKIQNSKTKISFTLPVGPSGLDSKGKAVVKALAVKHVKVNVYNAMAMDYGIPGEGTPDMGERAKDVGDALHSQLQSLLHISRAAAWPMVGLTPMIGINDVYEAGAHERFDLSDASDLVGYAKSHGIGMIGMWQLARDHEGTNCPTDRTSEKCSGISPQDDYQFSKILSGISH